MYQSCIYMMTTIVYCVTIDIYVSSMYYLSIIYVSSMDHAYAMWQKHDKTMPFYNFINHPPVITIFYLLVL